MAFDCITPDHCLFFLLMCVMDVHQNILCPQLNSALFDKYSMSYIILAYME